MPPIISGKNAKNVYWDIFSTENTVIIDVNCAPMPTISDAVQNDQNNRLGCTSSTYQLLMMAKWDITKNVIVAIQPTTIKVISELNIVQNSFHHNIDKISMFSILLSQNFPIKWIDKTICEMLYLIYKKTIKWVNFMTYVLSDIHGQADAFFDILEQINFSDDDVLYILGDIVDRGPKIFEVFDYIENKSNIHLIMGNHERMMIDFLDSMGESIEYNNEKIYSSLVRSNYRLWIRNGGMITYDYLLAKDKEYQTKFMDMVRSLPYYKIIEINGQNFILCHGRPTFYELQGVENPTVENMLDALTIAPDYEILWNRDLWSQHTPDGYKVIHGHSPVQYAFGVDEITSYSYDEFIDIDCGCAGKYKLACLRLEDMKEFYSTKMI